MLEIFSKALRMNKTIEYSATLEMKLAEYRWRIKRYIEIYGSQVIRK